MTESKQREFWIYSFKSGRTQISESKVTIETQFYAPYDDPTRPLKPSEVIHVIEYSAFEQLQKENKYLRTVVLNPLSVNIIDENELLKRKLDVALDALVTIGEYWNQDCNETATKDMSIYATNTAQEALKEIEAIK